MLNEPIRFEEILIFVIGIISDVCMIFNIHVH